MSDNVEGAGQSFSVLSGHPRPADWIVIDGRSPGLRISDDHRPSRKHACSGAAQSLRKKPADWSFPDDRQSAYSCGGSHGLGPAWVVLTVFPINPRGVFLGEPSRPVIPDCPFPSRTLGWEMRHVVLIANGNGGEPMRPPPVPRDFSRPPLLDKAPCRQPQAHA